MKIGVRAHPYLLIQKEIILCFEKYFPYGLEESAVLAVLAGNDLLISSDFTTQIPAVLEAVEEGVIPQSQIDSAVLRVLRWKQQLGLLAEEENN